MARDQSSRRQICSWQQLAECHSCEASIIEKRKILLSHLLSQLLFLENQGNAAEIFPSLIYSMVGERRIAVDKLCRLPSGVFLLFADQDKARSSHLRIGDPPQLAVQIGHWLFVPRAHPGREFCLCNRYFWKIGQSGFPPIFRDILLTEQAQIDCREFNKEAEVI